MAGGKVDSTVYCWAASLADWSAELTAALWVDLLVCYSAGGSVVMLAALMVGKWACVLAGLKVGQ